tara:strand:+ start:8773 stop:9747 length:975 start_codon:yes stop_codon:yes gene_type:complete
LKIDSDNTNFQLGFRKIKVAILMSTYNGQGYIKEQLESINSQSFKNFTLFISDDGSRDQTCLIVKEFVSMHPNMEIVLMDGPRAGFAANFMMMLDSSGSGYDFYAFSDQDDIWDPDKLDIAIRQLNCSGDPFLNPCLYGSRTEIVDVEGNSLGYSPLFKRDPKFSNALVQNICGGNTMLITNSLRKYMLKVSDHSLIVSHDWFSYLAVTAIGGTVIYDEQPKIKYRQHGSNWVGSNLGWKARLRRLYDVFVKGTFKEWHTKNIECLGYLKPYMPHQNKTILAKFVALRKESYFKAVLAMKSSGVYRQTVSETITLYAAVFWGRV